MNDQDLEEALRPVIDFHRAGEPTVGTVLAAHLRSHGVPPSGAAWFVAKQALADGMDFAAAAALAAGGVESSAPDVREPRTGQSATEPSKIQERRSGATAWNPPPAVQEQSTPTEDAGERPTPSTDHLDQGQRATASTPTDPMLPLRKSDEQPELQSSAVLEWFPKVYGPGDIDGAGAAKLLGTPNVPLSTVLVRETAQNSWDARLGGAKQVLFSLNLRQLSAGERTVLRERILTGAATKLGLVDSFARDELWVLEVSDRGTKGLGGPVRNDISVPMDETTNFIDLVLNVGAPRDVHLGGGTYGFGKTISYRVSRSGTVLIWSRSVEADGPEDRLIGSAIGGSFDSEHRRYTGRHWWGVTRDAGARVEPLRGELAAVLASQVFRSTFEPGQTGTSLMIVDPDLGGESRDADARRLAEAVLWHLWPKLVKDHEGNRPMDIEVLLEGVPVELPPVESHPVLAGYADALQSVRAKQLGHTYTPRFNTEVFEINSRRPIETLGHLAISRYGWNPRNSEESEIAPFPGPSSHVAWMRHDAELLVKYDAFAPLDTEGLQWAGVYKPTDETDDAYASAEPPAHDDWVSNSITDSRQRTRVRNGLSKVQDRVREFLSPRVAEPDSAHPRKSTAALADSLARLVGGLPGSGPSQPKAGTGSKRKPRPRAQITDIVRGEAAGDQRLLLLQVEVPGAKDPVGVVAHVGVAVEGAPLEDSQVEVLGWRESSDGTDLVDEPPSLSDGDKRWLVVRAHKDVAVEVDVKTTEGS